MSVQKREEQKQTEKRSHGDAEYGSPHTVFFGIFPDVENRQNAGDQSEWGKYQ
jgi:hypothetical protein